VISFKTPCSLLWKKRPGGGWCFSFYRRYAGFCRWDAKSCTLFPLLLSYIGLAPIPTLPTDPCERPQTRYAPRQRVLKINRELAHFPATSDRAVLVAVASVVCKRGFLRPEFALGGEVGFSCSRSSRSKLTLELSRISPYFLPRLQFLLAFCLYAFRFRPFLKTPPTLRVEQSILPPCFFYSVCSAFNAPHCLYFFP